MGSQEQNEDQNTGRVFNLVIIAPTPFYYQVPLFRTLAKHPRLNVKVYYCSDEALYGRDVPKKFKTKADWGSDEDLLQGYDYKFMRNFSPRPSYLNSLVGLVNLEIWGEITRERPDVVILMSWMNPTWWLAILACLRTRIPFLYLTDQNIQRDLSAPKWKLKIKNIVLGKFLFRLTSGFLCAGEANRSLYQLYGVPDHKLVPFAFSWGYDSLLDVSKEFIARKKDLKQELGLPEDSYVVLYCGRLSPEKSPKYLVQAYEKIDHPNKVLLIVGDGQLRQQLQEYVTENEIESVHFMGFQTRPEIPKYYAVSDVLVLPSDTETWGIVVNEAMCFGLPVIASDQVGAVRDMVKTGYNGFSFPQGDVDALASNLHQLMDQGEEERREMSANSRNLIEQWTHRDLAQSLDRYFGLICSKKRGETGN